jgi:hypothetical protein
MLNPNLGRVLSAVGACLLIVTLFVVWYDIDRTAAEGTTTSTGWQAFPRLRIAVLVGAVLTFVTALPRQTRPVLIARTLLGLGLAMLITRRIVDAPDLSVPLHPQPGIYGALAGALFVALGGLVDTGRRVAAAYPGLGGGGRAPALPPGGGGSQGGAAVRVPNEAERGGRLARR